MNWYYVQDGQQAGPVTEAEFDALVKAGTIKPDTLVWREGMTDWQPYGEVQAGSAAASPVQPAGGLVCSVCGNVFQPDEVVRYENAWVCAACKPMFLGRLKEGVGVAGATIDPAAFTQQVLARDYALDIGQCLSRSWELLKGNFWLVVGCTCLVYLCLMAAGMVPFLGGFIQLIINGALFGGLYTFFLKLIRTRVATINDVFSGFGPRFVQLMLVHLVSSLLMALCMVPGILAVVFGMVGFAGRAGGGDIEQFFSAMGPWMIAFIILIGVGFCAVVYLSVSWIFAIALVADKGFNFWPALELSRKVVGKHWWMVFFFLFVNGLVAISGLIACCIGMAVTIPIAFGALVYAYKDIFG